MIRAIFLLSCATAALAATLSCNAEADMAKKAPPTAAKPAVTPAMLEQGRALYAKTCTACHGESGKGDGPGAAVPPPADHTNAAYMDTLTDKDIAAVIQMGGAVRGKPLMPSHPNIRGADLDALVAYVRSLSHPKVTP